MKLPHLHLRDLLWLLLVVGLALAWWSDRREADRLQVAAERLDALALQSAEARFLVAETEQAMVDNIVRKAPGAISQTEVQLTKARFQAAKMRLETVRTKSNAGAAKK
ncbi:hypothetical protein [Anatilimnocola floriformis]|uniref:hypothetical protein n=1 Tax=Anatilimnocola floriformis TaxID=2948575 RepID=UPI0020C55545|nr:hypothetical protein [Anatilimnocola floriformis]